MSIMVLLLLLNQHFAVEQKSDQLSEMVGKNFLDQIANRDAKRAAKLAGTTVNFDGEVVKGAGPIAQRLERMITRHRAPIRFKRTLFFTGEEALARFGPLPARLGAIDLQRSAVLLGQREKGGIAVILQQVTDSTGRWPRVVALTD